VGPLAVVAAGLAIAWAAVVRHRATLALTVPAIGHAATFLVPIQYFYVRFAMPIMFIVSVLAARGLTLAVSRTPSRLGRASLLAVVLSWPAVLSGDLVVQMLADSRYEAARWLARHTVSTDRVAHCAPLGELPHLDPAIETVRLTSGSAFASVAALRPDLIIVQPDWMSAPEEPHSGSCPTAFYAALEDGTLGYRRVASFHTPSLISRRLLDYPSVNPPVQVFARGDRQDVE
jgi:hypothetical protein